MKLIQFGLFNNFIQINMTQQLIIIESQLKKLPLKLFNEQKLKQYKAQFENSLYKDLLDLMSRSFKKRVESTQHIANQISWVFGLEVKVVNQILASKRKTDITKLWTQLLIPSERERRALQKKRMSLIVSLRRNQTIQENNQISDFTILHQILSLNQIKVPIQPQNQKTIKTMLTSLKKIMGVGKQPPNENKKTKKAKRCAYLINLDLKAVFEEIVKKIKDVNLKDKMRSCLNDSKNKNWFGPNLYKILTASSFTNQEIKIVIQFLENIHIQSFEIKSNRLGLKKNIQKIISNLKINIGDIGDIKLQKVSQSNDSEDFEVIKLLETGQHDCIQYIVQQMMGSQSIILQMQEIETPLFKIQYFQTF